MWGWCCNCCGKKEREAAKIQQLSKFNVKKGSSSNFQAGDARRSKHSSPSLPRSHASTVSFARVVPSSNASICFPQNDSDSSSYGVQEKTFSELKWTIYPSNSHTKHPRLSVPRRTYTVLDEDTNKKSNRKDFTIIGNCQVEEQFGRRKATRYQKRNGNDMLKLDLPDICSKPNQERINQQLREAFEKESRALERIKRERIARMSTRSSSRRSQPTTSGTMPAKTQGKYSASTYEVGRECDAKLQSLQLHKSRANMLLDRDAEEISKYSPTSRQHTPNRPPISREPKHKSKYYQGYSENRQPPPSRQVSLRNCVRPPTPRVADQKHGFSFDGRGSQDSRSTLRSRRNGIERRKRSRQEIFTVNGHELIATNIEQLSDGDLDKRSQIIDVSETAIENNEIGAEMSESQPTEPSRLSLWFQKFKKKPSEKSPQADLLKLYSRTSQSLIQLQDRKSGKLRNDAGAGGGKSTQRIQQPSKKKS